MRARLGGSHADLAGRRRAIDMKQRDVGNAKASVDRQRNKIRHVVAVPFVTVSLAVLLASLVHAPDLVIREGKLLLVARFAISRPFGFLTARAGLLPIHLLLTRYSKNGLSIAMRRTPVWGLTGHVERNCRTSIGSH
jgi:hypothetical protein